MMRVLVVSQHYWPETFRINEVVESLQKCGCIVTVLTGQPNYPSGEIFPGFKAMKACRSVHEAGYQIYRVPVIPRGNGSALRLACNYFSFVLSACLCGSWLLRNKRFDLVFVYAPSPILQAIPAIWLAFLKRAKLITWVQDLWPSSLEATGFVQNRRLLAVTALLVRWIYRRCDLLLVQSRAFVLPVTAMAGETAVKYHPNPGELAFSQNRTLGLPALALKPGFNLVFAGNLGTVQALGTVLDAAVLLQPYPDVHIVLVGTGSRSVWLHQEVDRRQLGNVQLPGRFSPEEMPGIFVQASALLVSLVRSPVMSQTVPSKVQAYLAAGKPIIASLDGEGARVVAESGAGISCPAENAPALVAAVLRLRAMSCDELHLMGEAGANYYQKNFEPTALSRKLMQFFSDALAVQK